MLDSIQRNERIASHAIATDTQVLHTVCSVIDARTCFTYVMYCFTHEQLGNAYKLRKGSIITFELIGSFALKMHVNYVNWEFKCN